MILKVKEPQPQEYERFREGQVLFTYLHLAADEGLTRFLAERKVAAVAYETVQTPDGRLPLLAPMSEIAGRMAPHCGAANLERPKGGRGVLMGGASGVAPARVVVLGAGMAGTNAAWIAAGMEAEVAIVDKNVERLRFVDQIWRGRIQTVMSSRLAIERLVTEADLVIGAVLVPGAKAPHLVSEDMVAGMQPGAVVVDISIDQGGCFETSHVTTHSDPTYVVHDVVHYCVGNMPGAVPRTSTYALTNVTIPYAVEIATAGLEDAVRARPALGARRQRLRRARDERGRRRGARHADDTARLTRRRAGIAAGRRAMGDTLAVWADRYLDHLTVERGLSPNTLAAYRRDLRPVRGLLRGSATCAIPNEVVDADDPLVRGLDLGVDLGRGRTPVQRAVRRADAVVRAVVPPVPRCAKARPSAIPTAAVVQPKLPRSLPHPLPVDEVARLLEAPDAATLVGLARPRDPRGAVRSRTADLRARRARRRRRRPGGGVRPGPRQRREGAGGPARGVRPRGGECLPRRARARRSPLRRSRAALFLNQRGGRLTRQSCTRLLARHVTGGRDRAAGDAAHAPAFVRDPPAGGRRGRPRRAGAARARERRHHPDLHAGDQRPPP